MQTDIVKEIIHLPISDRMEIIEQLSRSVRRDLRDSENQEVSKEAQIEKRRQAIQRLRGIAKVEGQRAPTKEEWREERADYLLEKYK
jgi:hypothetical protein